MASPTPPADPQVRSHRSRLGLLAALALVVLAAIGVGLALFQPWKLWVDETVDQAAPAGASPIPASPAAAPAVPATPPSTEAPAVAASAATPSNPPVSAAVAPVPTIPATSAPAAPSPPPAAAFVSLDHGTTGALVLLQGDGGQRFVRFENLDTSNGPDLKVYLSTNTIDGPESTFDDDIVNLGRLQGNVGSQNYEIPADTDLTRYRSVVIWCDRFDSAFGATPLG